jgi:hypothetical protein
MKIDISNNKIIKDFFDTLHIDYKKTSNNMRINVNCPFCMNDTKYKMTLNFDWGNCHCYKESSSKSIFAYLKKIGELYNFYEYYTKYDISNKYDIISKLNSLYKNKELSEEIKTKTGFQKYINDYGLFPVNKLYYANKYALSRTNNDNMEINNYYADEKYIYIPIYNNYEIVSFIARRYIELDEIPRYKKPPTESIYNFKSIDTSFAFLDEYLSDFTENTLYIAEGYFDAYAINKSFNKYVAISLLGKNFSLKSIEELEKYISTQTNIVLCLDSPEKDGNIISDIFKVGNRLINVFPYVSVVLFDKGDPNEIFCKNGSLSLRNALNNKISYMNFFLKYSMLGNIISEKNIKEWIGE